MSVVGIAKERAGLREKRTDKSEVYYKRTFLVKTNDPKDDTNVAEKAFGLPQRGFNYVTEKTVDLTALCYSISTKQTSIYTWEVECEYSSDPTKLSDEDKDDGGGKDPKYEQPTYVWGGTNIREVVTGQSQFVDYQIESTEEVKLFKAEGILNSAYEPFMPPAEIDRWIPTLTIERYQEHFDHRIMLLYVNSVNNRSWYHWPERTVKCAAIEGTLQVVPFKGKLRKYWKVRYTLHFNKYTWDLYLLDHGTYYFDGGRNAVPLRKKPFITKGVATGLGLLTSDGDNASNVSRYIGFRILDEMNFHRLQIPFIT